MFNHFFSLSLVLAFLFCLSCSKDNDPTSSESEWPDFTLVNPTNIGAIVNSSDYEGSPSISADGLELYFGSTRPGGHGNNDLWVTTRATTSDGWGTPVNLGAVVNDTAAAGTPSISADGLTLYFSDWGKPRVGGQGSVDLWMTTRPTKNDLWTTPVNLGPTVNTSGFEVTPEVSADGLELYFESDRPGGYGLDDLYVSKRTTTAAGWSTPVNLGPVINDSLWQHCPTISDDGLTFFFDSDFPGDLLVSRRETISSAWETPVNLGDLYSSHYASDVTSDFTILYYISEHSGGQGGPDIWQVTIESK